MKKDFRIGELSGYAWECAIVNVGAILCRNEKESKNSWAYIERVASKLNVRFDVNGNIM
jgi:hypothetical protein